MAILGGYRLTRTGIVFVIGVVVLAGLVTGGIFLVKNHGEAVRRDEAVKVAEQNLKDQSEVATQPQPADATDQSEQAAPGTTPAQTGPSTTPGTDATQLPTTGIDDVQGLQRVLIVAALALSVAVYVASRRASARL